MDRPLRGSERRLRVQHTFDLHHFGNRPCRHDPGHLGRNRPGFVQTTSSGFTGGGQIGYNYQIGATPIPFFGALGGTGAGGLVVGVEADAAYTDLRNNTGIIGLNGSGSFFNTRVNYVGTARGRVGFAFGDLLIFGTGGFAYGGVTNTAIYTPGRQQLLRAEQLDPHRLRLRWRS